MTIANDLKMASGAFARALDNNNIFDTILLHLDQVDILRIQAVNKYFRTAIAESIYLQQKLFFKPLVGGKSHQPELNPLLASLFPPLFTLNRPEYPNSLAYLQEQYGLEWLSDPVRRERILRPGASWRRMFPVQPPAKLDAITINMYDSCTHSVGTLIPTRIGSRHQHLQAEGIRMGLLFDLIVRMHDIHLDTSFFVHWQMFPIGSGTDKWQERDEDCDPHWYKESDYAPLFSPWEVPELSNTITLYHNHDSLCGGYKLPSPLEPDSPFQTEVDEDPTSLFEYEVNPGTYATRWLKYGTFVGKFT